MSTVTKIPIKDIYMDDTDFNSRGKVVPFDTTDLVKSLEERGLIQPVVVRPYNKNGKAYTLVVGFRRTVAHKVLKAKTNDPKWDCIDAIIREDLSDEDALILNLTENVARRDLNILQEAIAIKKLTSVCFTPVKIADRVGKTLGWVNTRLNLLKLPEKVQIEAGAGFLNAKNIDDLFKVYRGGSFKNDEKIFDLVKKIKERKQTGERKQIEIIKKPVTSRTRRTPTEIMKMQEFMQDKIGNGLHTRITAWCSGEISTLDLFCDISYFAAMNDMPAFTIPKESL